VTPLDRLPPPSPLAALFWRITEIPGAAWAAGAVTAVCGVIVRDPFWGITALLLASSALDYYWGRRVATHFSRIDPAHPRRFDPLRAHAGWQSKALSLCLLLLIRGVEAWAMRHAMGAVVESSGLLSVMLGVGLVVADIESIDHHRTALGARPIPVLAQILAVLRRIESRVFPIPDAPAPPRAPLVQEPKP
jgi:hypothetical protein